MPIKLLSAAAILAVFTASPVFAFEQHQSHAMQTTAEAAPVIVVPEVSVTLPQSTVVEERALSVAPEATRATGGYGGCFEKRQTVYLTN